MLIKITFASIIDRIRKHITEKKVYFIIELAQDAVTFQFRFCYNYQVSSQPQYSYSQQTVDFIFDEIKKAPDTIIGDMKNKKANPRSKGF